MTFTHSKLCKSDTREVLLHYCAAQKCYLGGVEVCVSRRRGCKACVCVCVCVAHSPFVHKIIKSSPRVHLLQIEAPRRWAARCAPRGSNFTSDRWIRVSTAAARDAATPPPIVLTLDLLTAPAVPKAGSEAPGGAFDLAKGVRLNIIKSL